MKIAAFDIGTNSIHMLIVEIHKDLSYEIQGHEKDTTRLGDGSFEEKKLRKPAMDRALQVIDRFCKIAKKSGVRKMVACATSAVRESKNGGEFVEEILKRTGLRVQVVSGEEEGRLVYLAAKSGIETDGQKNLVIDIGGGSVEFILGCKDEILYLESLKLGVTRLRDRFVAHDPAKKSELRRLKAAVIKEAKKTVRKLRKIGYSMLIGTSGTMINLASIVHEGREKKPLKIVNHFELSLKDLEKAQKKLLKMNQEQRLKMPGLDPKRADIIPSGSVLLVTLMQIFKMDKITLCDKNIREGIILDFIEKNRKRLGEDETLSIRERSVLQLARRCQVNETHANQVARIATDLFDKTVPLHRLENGERDLLRYSALLHDVGHYVSFKKHHKHSHYLIVNSDMDGFTPEEIELMGAVAKMHRKKAPRKGEIAKRGQGERYRLQVLSSILRIADGLDRTHYSVVKAVDCRISDKEMKLVVTPRPRQDTELEVWQAAERSDFFERLFKRKVRVVVTGEKNGRV